ncbi:hypothetical protein [Roseovarius sp. SYSU LYC5161]|uniref:hypothetical protein n=1 Tax=Roseovarius halophilus (ex Wu et al. 2025) TaxID=3376060 RepID=UPI00399B5B67
MILSTHDKYAAVRREIRQRRRVYPRLIEQGKMSQADADREIAIMEAIADDYDTKADMFAQRRQG